MWLPLYPNSFVRIPAYLTVFWLCNSIFTTHAHVAPAQNNALATHIVVFVHGMLSIKYHLSLDNIIRFASDNVQDCIYEKTVDIMRKDPFFFKKPTDTRAWP